MTKETSLGGKRYAFPQTHWSMLLRAIDGDAQIRRDALEKLLAAYWKPVYSCIRFGWNRSVEDAKDLVQEFFADLLERDVIRDVDPLKGRFRSFLKSALKNFLLNKKAERSSLKRGGGVRFVSFDGIEHMHCKEREPDQVFDSAWIRGIVERATADLEAEMRVAGKPKVFRVFELYDLGRGGHSYRAVAQETGISESDVVNFLHRARGRFRAILIRCISEYALDEQDAQDELRWILK